MTTIEGQRLVELRARQRVVEQAMALMAERGLYDGLLEEAIGRAKVPREQAHIFFRRDKDLIVALHERLAGDFEACLADLPPGTVAERFEGAMRLRLCLLYTSPSPRD